MSTSPSNDDLRSAATEALKAADELVRIMETSPVEAAA